MLNYSKIRYWIKIAKLISASLCFYLFSQQRKSPTPKLLKFILQCAAHQFHVLSPFVISMSWFLNVVEGLAWGPLLVTYPGPWFEPIANTSSRGTRIGAKLDLSDYECSMTVGISENTDLLGFSHAFISPRNKIPSERQLSGQKCLADERDHRRIAKLLWAYKKVITTNLDRKAFQNAQHVKP